MLGVMQVTNISMRSLDRVVLIIRQFTLKTQTETRKTNALKLRGIYPIRDKEAK
jgi:hypothetical protein